MSGEYYGSGPDQIHVVLQGIISQVFDEPFHVSSHG
jgi:hypothetical protein